MAMMWLKIARELVKPKKDNRADLGGYLLILDRMENSNEQGIQGRVDTIGSVFERESVVDGEDTSDGDIQPTKGTGMLRVESLLGRVFRD
jgi:hypothetical protein